ASEGRERHVPQARHGILAGQGGSGVLVASTMSSAALDTISVRHGGANPDPKFVTARNCARNAPEGPFHASNGAMSPHHFSICGGPSDALESTELAACGQG